MPKMLVTGGTGFNGSHAVDLFVERGYQVMIMGEPSHVLRMVVSGGCVCANLPVSNFEQDSCTHTIGWIPTVALGDRLSKGVEYLKVSERID